MNTCEQDQRPPVERAAVAINDAADYLKELSNTLASLLARGELSTKARAALNETVLCAEAAIVRARSAIGEISP